MSSAPFPERIDAIKMFAREGSITAQLPLARLQRFNEQLSNSDGAVAVDLRFGRDEEGRRLLSGTLDTKVQVACQRCLQDMDLDLHCDMALLVFDTEEEVAALHEDQDGVVMSEDGDLDVKALIEDELILSLPMIPMHDDIACSKVLNELKEDEAADANRSNPFAILAGLKTAAETRQADQAAKQDKAKPSGTKARPGKKS